MKNVCLFLIAFTVLVSCSKSKQYQRQAEFSEVSEMACIKLTDISEKKESKENKNVPIDPKTHEKKIIKDGKIGLQTDSVEEVKEILSKKIKEFGGYVGSEKQSNQNGHKTLEMLIRVPAANFEKLIAGIENGKNKVLYKNISARDVTEEFMDVESRLQTKQKFAERYQELLKKANAVKDILEIEENLRTLQEEIESSKGRLKYLSDQVDYSSLEIHLTQDKEIISYQPGFGRKILDSITLGWQILISILLFIIQIWPIELIFLVVFLGSKRTLKHYKQRREQLKRA